MGRPSKYSDELRRRAIDEVIERGCRIPVVARDLGIGSPERLRNWVKQARTDRGLEPGPSTEELAEIKKLRKGVTDPQRTIQSNVRCASREGRSTCWGSTPRDVGSSSS
jgi:transposase